MSGMEISTYEKELQDLRDELEVYKAAFEESHDIIHIIDKDGITLQVNKACEIIDGLKKEDIIGKNIGEFVKNGYYSKSVALEVLKEGTAITIIQKVKSGKEMITTGTPIYKNGVIDKVIVNSRDISELNELRKEIIEKEKLTEKYFSELEILRKNQLETGDLIVKSSEMMNIYTLALRISKVDSTVLIQGESGVGKGLLAKFIHKHSDRNNGAFIKIDCGSIPYSLIESELFGYEKGAFTGSDKHGKLGLVELADGGTLFLDEIGEIPLNLQVKILSLLQDRELLRIGGHKPIPVNIRVIAATNRNLEKMIEEGTFRKDLFYRLNVIPINIPPLKERLDDIPPIINRVMTDLNKKYKLSKGIDTEAMDILMNYDWPGNIRELENLIERLIVTISDDSIRAEHLPSAIREKYNVNKFNRDFKDRSMKDLVNQFEKNVLEQAIANHKSVKQIADLLQMDISTVRKKMKRLGIHYNS